MADVLFGDVYLCSGQSNIRFSMPAVANASSERQLANKYPNIRSSRWGCEPRAHSTAGPADGGAVAGGEQRDHRQGLLSDAICSQPSAVCWLFGRQLSDALSPKGEVPIGLISSNWGGTKLEV